MLQKLLDWKWSRHAHKWHFVDLEIAEPRRFGSNQYNYFYKCNCGVKGQVLSSSFSPNLKLVKEIA